MAKVIDSHLHVWASKEESAEFPYAKAEGYVLQLIGGSTEPTIPGSVDLLLRLMRETGVDGALIVQPANHLYDHTYVRRALQLHPDKFVGCLLADPTRPDCATELERLVKEEGFRAVRFNPYLWPQGGSMLDERGRAMYAKAGELGVPVSVMLFKGLHLHVYELQQLLDNFPDTKLIIDHFGFCNLDDLQAPAWDALFGLAKYPQVYVKAAAYFRLSKEPYPCVSAAHALRRVVDAFGAQRVMFGSDWPYVAPAHGYKPTWELFDTWEAVLGKQLFSADEREWIRGRTISSLFPGGWAQKS